MVHRAVIVAALFLLGCYRSHQRPADGATPLEDAAVSDAALPIDAAPRFDAGIDAGPETCEYALAGTLDVRRDGARLVTPRLVWLGDELGIVIVGSGLGDPTAILFAVASRDLSRVTELRTLVTHSFTWAEPVADEGGFALCWGDDGGGSLLQRFDAAGAAITMPARVPLPGHCEDLVESAGRYALIASGPTGDPPTVVMADEHGALIGAPFVLEGSTAPSLSSIAETPDGFAIGHVRWAVGDNGTFLEGWSVGGAPLPTRIADPGDTAIRLARGPGSLGVLRFLPPRALLQARDPRTFAPIGTEIELATGLIAPRLAAITAGWVVAAPTPSELGLSIVRGDSRDEVRVPLDPGFHGTDVDLVASGHDVYVSAHVDEGLESFGRVLHFACR